MRNTGAQRVSHHINRHPAVNLHHATRYCERIGLPLNRFVTVNFTAAGCDSAHASRVLQRLLAQRFAPWLRRSKANVSDVPPTYVWTLEAAGGQTAAHWLVHMPSRLARAFERKVPEWLFGLLGAPADASAVKIGPVYNLVGARRYILKGTSEPWAAHLGVQHVPQGLVTGKRSGFSRNLGPSARSRGGYAPRRAPFLRQGHSPHSTA